MFLFYLSGSVICVLVFFTCKHFLFRAFCHPPPHFLHTHVFFLFCCNVVCFQFSRSVLLPSLRLAHVHERFFLAYLGYICHVDNDQGRIPRWSFNIGARTAWKRMWALTNHISSNTTELGHDLHIIQIVRSDENAHLLISLGPYFLSGRTPCESSSSDVVVFIWFRGFCHFFLRFSILCSRATAHPSEGLSSGDTRHPLHPWELKSSMRPTPNFFTCWISRGCYWLSFVRITSFLGSSG